MPVVPLRRGGGVEHRGRGPPTRAPESSSREERDVRRRSHTSGTTLEHELEAMLEIERFEPPDGVPRERAAERPRGLRRGRRRSAGVVGRAGRGRSTGPEPWDTVLDDSNPPFYKWFAGGKLNASHNCLDRHVEAGRGDRVAYHWRGEEGEERDVTYADLHRDVQRFANALKDLGIGQGDVVGIYLPMIPEVVVAMLACARIGAPHNVVFGGFSRRVGPRADGVLRGEGADHGRRRAAQGQDRADQGDRSTRSWATSRRCETIVVVRHTGIDCEMRTGATSSTTRSARPPTRSARPSRSTPSTRCSSSTRPARRRSRRASCTRPAAT